VKPHIHPSCWIAPNAIILGKVRLLKGASIWFGAVLRGDNDWITVGENSNVQDLSLIHADPGQPVTLGMGGTVGHRVIIHSATVGDNSLVGMGSILLNRVRVGSDCLVGAGALITESKEFGDGKLILGAPATVARDLTTDQVSRLRESSQTYVANAVRYRATLREQPLGADDSEGVPQ
jgi:carbonic anhydrase/acetyltransferase-like protein (isoleucine patch superfamily)